MSQSLTQLYTHIVFHTKTNSPLIRPKDSDQLYLYIGGIINHTHCKPIAINGMPDHIHVLCTLSKSVSLSKLVQYIKPNSSRWLKSLDTHYRYFEWQAGYGAFSVSSSLLDKTINYIMNQGVHHQKRDFREEYMLFLKNMELILMNGICENERLLCHPYRIQKNKMSLTQHLRTGLAYVIPTGFGKFPRASARCYEHNATMRLI